MSRLIDADKLIERIEEITSTDMMKVLVEDWINSEPTAYDLDKVVEQLEESYFITESTFDDDGWCNDDSEEVLNLNEAIEIVKRGGIDE